MPTKHKTDYQIKQVLKYNKDGPPNRQEERHRVLMKAIKDLQENRGYSKRWDIHKLGKKEVSRLVYDWRQSKTVGHRAIANRMAHIRWLADKVNRLDQIPSNKDIGVGLRKSDPNYGKNKAVELDREILKLLPERAQLITELRREFGLRTKGAVKFSYKYATAGNNKDQISLKKSWTKGGRARTIDIVNERQRDLLRRVGEFQERNKDRSMIPNHRTYKSFYRDYNELRAEVGIPGHALRHQWAQERFKQASGGIDSPHAGGPKYSELNTQDQARWDLGAKTVNRELGHGDGRQDITATYIGARV